MISASCALIVAAGWGCGDDADAAALTENTVTQSGEDPNGASPQGSAGAAAGDEGTAATGAQNAGDPAEPASGGSMATDAPAEGEPVGDSGGTETGAESGGDAGGGGENDGAGDGGSGGDTGGNDESDGQQDPDEAVEGTLCDLDCEAGQHCELVAVQCVTDPCPPLPSCVETPFCGGFAGFACPGAGECVDDPRDDCDPNAGGADCGGLCQCPAEPPRACRRGTTWNAAPTSCSCVSSQAQGDGGDNVCGDNVCGDGQYCCNRSCGICAPVGGACTQQFCG